MIYITQFIFVTSGKEDVFLAFEDQVIPLMEQYHGKVIYRICPTTETVITGEETPYEIHFLSFPSEDDLNNFLNDDRRLAFKHLKDESVRTSWLFKGEKF